MNFAAASTPPDPTSFTTITIITPPIIDFNTPPPGYAFAKKMQSINGRPPTEMYLIHADNNNAVFVKSSVPVLERNSVFVKEDEYYVYDYVGRLVPISLQETKLIPFAPIASQVTPPAPVVPLVQPQQPPAGPGGDEKGPCENDEAQKAYNALVNGGADASSKQQARDYLNNNSCPGYLRILVMVMKRAMLREPWKIQEHLPAVSSVHGII